MKEPAGTPEGNFTMLDAIHGGASRSFKYTRDDINNSLVITRMA
jgi:hypothetical protein